MAQIIQPFEQSKHPECKTDCSQGQAAVQDEYPADGTARFKFGAIVDFRHAPHFRRHSKRKDRQSSPSESEAGEKQRQEQTYLKIDSYDFTLPPLPYAMDALAPVMSRETIEYHYGKHLQTYIDNLNRLIDGTEYEDATLEEIVMNAVGPVYNNAAQAWNHTFFFNSLTPESAEIPASLKNALERDFGSVETFKEKFQKSATDLFGSGWAWLAQDKEGKLHIMQEPNAGNPLKSGHKPLLTIDVWEHAYYIDYRNKRAAFAEKFWEIVNWDKVSERMESECVCSEIENLVQKSEMSDEATAEEDKDDEASADMGRYVCVTCGYIYDPEEGDPENGVAPGTPFSEIPQEWVCPACGVGKEYFEKER